MTDVLPIHALLHRARRDLEVERGLREAAQHAHEAAEEVARRAEERAQSEADRADGAEAQVVAILARYLIDPDGELTGDLPESIAETIRQDLCGGLSVEDIPEQVRSLREDQ